MDNKPPEKKQFANLSSSPPESNEWVLDWAWAFIIIALFFVALWGWAALTGERELPPPTPNRVATLVAVAAGTQPPTSTSRPTRTRQPTQTPTHTSTPSPTDTAVPTATPPPTEAPPPTATAVPTDTPSPTDTPVPTATAAPTTDPSPTDTPSPTATDDTADTGPATATAVENAALFAAADVTSQRLETFLAAGESARILAKDRPDPGWWLVELEDGTQGWVSAGFVETSGQIEFVEIR